jgi:type I restriction enzyme M protein
MPANQDLDYTDTLWKTADALRGQIDAAEYKHVVLGLLFLKYISDAFESRRDELRSELQKDGFPADRLESQLETRDEYLAERVFWVPPESRWPNLQNQATRPDIATFIFDGILGSQPASAQDRGIGWHPVSPIVISSVAVQWKGKRCFYNVP